MSKFSVCEFPVWLSIVFAEGIGPSFTTMFEHTSDSQTPILVRYTACGGDFNSQQTKGQNMRGLFWLNESKFAIDLSEN